MKSSEMKNRSIFGTVLLLPGLLLIVFILKPFFASKFSYITFIIILSFYLWLFFDSKASTRCFLLFRSVFRQKITQWLLYWCLATEQMCASSIFFFFLMCFNLGLIIAISPLEDNANFNITYRLIVFIVVVYWRLRRTFINSEKLNLEDACDWNNLLSKFDKTTIDSYKSSNASSSLVFQKLVPNLQPINNKLVSKSHVEFPFLLHKRSMYRAGKKFGANFLEWAPNNPQDAVKLAGAAGSVIAGGTYFAYREGQKEQLERDKMQLERDKMQLERDKMQQDFMVQEKQMQQEFMVQEKQMQQEFNINRENNHTKNVISQRHYLESLQEQKAALRRQMVDSPIKKLPPGTEDAIKSLDERILNESEYLANLQKAPPTGIHFNQPFLDESISKETAILKSATNLSAPRIQSMKSLLYEYCSNIDLSDFV